MARMSIMGVGSDEVAEISPVASRSHGLGRTVIHRLKERSVVRSMSSGPPRILKPQGASVADVTRTEISSICVQRRSSQDALLGSSSSRSTCGGRRTPGLRLPSFKALGISSSDPKYLRAGSIPFDGATARRGSASALTGRASSPSPPPCSTSHRNEHIRCGVVPLLTPPEDAGTIKWNSIIQSSTSDTRPAVGAGTSAPASEPSSQRPSSINLPRSPNIPQDSDLRSTWLERACQQAVSALHDSRDPQHVQVVAQSLPAQTPIEHAKPVFEEVVEAIQLNLSVPPYITVTHAVPQVCAMEEIPRTPPVTPNIRNPQVEDYFEHQTIFTHAAVVPTYHTGTRQMGRLSPRPSTIAAPFSIDFSILERYIPPTSPQEFHDFFHLEGKSYLADRMSELSLNGGSLLLIYPTKTGAHTFNHKYIGPVLDPFLRQFLLLNRLYTTAAVLLGKMAALDGMAEYGEMSGLVADLCQALGQRPIRGAKCSFQVVYRDVAQVVMSRSSWIEGFVEQEKPRLHQNLADYHLSGGRMPDRKGAEVTAGTLTREVVEGIRHSREEAGNTGIEVGVFVIRRSAL